MEQPFRFRRVNEITGAFVLIIMLLVLSAIFLSGRLQDWFAQTYKFTVILPQEGAFGLSEGNEVLVMGVTAGWIDEIRVRNGRIIAIAKIEGEFRELVRSDSTARLQRAFAVAGETSLEIERGNGPVLAEESAIVALAPRDFIGEIDELVGGIGGEVEPILRRAREAMDEWATLAAELRGSQSHLSNALARVDGVMADIESGKGTLGQFLTDQQMAVASADLIKEANTAMKEVREVLGNLKEGTSRLPDIGDTLASEASDLPMLTLQAQQALQEIEDFFAGLQRHWLVRGAMQADEAPPPRIPPAQVEGRR
ncbi:MAG: hypothetical protein H0X66_18875 [Verrucomicrobia bacterium]|nr:hypothetical protein [Verrucomicrobiota bacterium]